MKQIYREGCRFHQCGVGLLDLRDRRFYQSDLFRPEQSAKSEALMAALDRINYRYGRDTVTIGSEGLTGRWTMKQQMLSPSYTSSWRDLPVVR